MQDKEKHIKLKKLFYEQTGEQADNIKLLPQSGSYREYYRISNKHHKLIGVFNEDIKENNAFLTFSRYFISKGLPVPMLYKVSEDRRFYLIEDLGNETLFNYLKKIKSKDKNEKNKKIRKIYKKIIKILPKFQLEGRNNFDYSSCYPRKSFDKQSMMWDLHYFKYHFLKLARIPFDEQLLEDDFDTFSDYLLKADCKYFLYRDLQSANIMLKNKEPYFIDYQGGRKGALHYDLASLLFDAKADLSNSLRLELLDFYIEEINKHIKIDAEEFKQFFGAYVFIRIMQAMGAYGFRGFFERKKQFLFSIPYATANLKWLLNNIKLPIETAELRRVLQQITESEYLKKISCPYTLNINIFSFSYKKEIPQDKSGNGGGHLFDCRVLPNPGRINKYKTKNGTQKSVINYLEKEEDVNNFFAHVSGIISLSVNNYKKRNFTNLMISFGCTGGQHRSVYMAERCKRFIENNFSNVKVKLEHTECKNWKKEI